MSALPFTQAERHPAKNYLLARRRGSTHRGARIEVFAPGNREWEWGVDVPAVVPDTEVTVLSPWSAAGLKVEDARGSLRLPIAMLPWWLFALLWTHADRYRYYRLLYDAVS